MRPAICQSWKFDNDIVTMAVRCNRRYRIVWRLRLSSLLVTRWILSDHVLHYIFTSLREIINGFVKIMSRLSGKLIRVLYDMHICINRNLSLIYEWIEISWPLTKRLERWWRIRLLSNKYVLDICQRKCYKMEYNCTTKKRETSRQPMW